MSAQVTITQLPSAGALTGTESVPIVQSGVTVQTTTGAIAGAGALNYPFLTTGSTGGLTQARALTAGTGLSLADGGAGTTLQVNMTGAAAALNAASTGLLVKTGTNTIANVALGVGSGMTIANADGVAGNPSIGLNTNLQNLSSLSGTGLVTINGSTFSQITITGASSQISVANGNSVPVIGIASDPVVPGTGGMVLPVGTTGQRGSSTNGNLRYNTTTATFEGYANGAWGSIVSGSGVSSISFGSTGLTPSTTTTGVVTVAGTLAVASGGTGVTTSTGTTNVVLSNSPTLVTPALGTPSALVGTNITGTAAGLTAGNVTTNANLTGDVTSVGNATTLATVASAGSTGSSTAIPVITINAKGLTTSITTAAVIAPAGTLSGATLASGVTASSLTSLGTITSLVVTAGTIATTPSAATDIANKNYVDTVAQGLDTKASVVAGTTANITLSGAQTIDGISIVATDRVLVKNQTAPAENGIYVASATAWARASDMSTWAQVPGAYVFIETGTTLADTGWVCTSNAGGTLGTTAITWAQFSGAGSGVSSITFGTTGLTPATTTTGAVTVGGTLGIANGGTGMTSVGAGSIPYAINPGALGVSGNLTFDGTTLNASAVSIAGGLSAATCAIGQGTFSNSLSVTGPATFTAGGTSTMAAINASGLVAMASAATVGTTLNVTGVATLGDGAILGTPASGVATNLTGLPLTTGVTGILPIANGGTGTIYGVAGGTF